MPIKLVAFDLDDCLFDSTGLSERARIKGIDAMINLGLKVERQKAIATLQEVVKEYGSNSSQHYDYFLLRLNQANNQLPLPSGEQFKYLAGAVMAYHEEKTKSIKAFEDVEPCLKKLRESGIKTAIITDGIPIKQYEKILRLNIDSLIDLIVVSDEIGIRKPNPKLFEYCLKKFGFKGSETIYVGDRIDSDIIPALLNNMYSVYIHRGGKYDINKFGYRIPGDAKPDYQIHELSEIFDIIEELNNKKPSKS